ncbi:hypothetical protein FI667_g8040, partial [Globisporangium splendens]
MLPQPQTNALSLRFSISSDSTLPKKRSVVSGALGTSSGRSGAGQGLDPIVNGGRPGTRQRSMLGSSAGGRPLTGRLGTGQQVPMAPGQTAGYGVSLNTEVNVSDRPVTQQGMMGMRVATGSIGPGRQVQDASFFVGKLHSKTAEITSEIERLRKEIEQDTKDKTKYAQLERKYETLAYEEAEEVDRIFILRQEQEKAVRRMEDEMNEIHMKHQDKIKQLAPQKLQRYKEMLEEHHQTEVEIEARSQELEMLMHAIHQKEAELSSGRYCEEYEQLEKQARRLQKERDNIQEDARTALMDLNEASALLLAKVKDSKAKIETIEKVIQVAEEENQELRKTLNEMQNEMDERVSGGGKDDPAQKYELLFQRDKETTAFLESSPAKKDEELRAHRQTQLMTVKLLEHISAGMAKEDKSLPTANTSNLDDMKKDLTFKERQLESSVTTKQRLAMELQKRQAEPGKVDTLDTKISLELSSLLQRMDTMTSDMGEFGKIDSLKETHQQTKQYLQRMKQQYICRRDAMKQQVNGLNLQIENLKQSTADHDTAKNLDSLEQKLRHHEQNIFHLREYIDTKSREIDYEHVKQDCFKVLQELNTLRIKQQGMLNTI